MVPTQLLLLPKLHHVVARRLRLFQHADVALPLSHRVADVMRHLPSRHADAKRLVAVVANRVAVLEVAVIGPEPLDRS